MEKIYTKQWGKKIHAQTQETKNAAITHPGNITVFQNQTQLLFDVEGAD